MAIVTPTNVKIREYHAIFNQTNTDEPIVTVLHNTLQGEPVWTRAMQGIFYITLEGAFPADRVLAEVSILNQGTRLTVQEVYDNNALQLQNRMMAAPYSLTDSIVGGTIIIRVYSKP